MNDGSSSAELEITIQHAMGLHARPAALFVRTAQRYPCSITVSKDGQAADAKSILSVLALAVTQGTTVRLVAEGDQAGAAIAALQALIEANFGDEKE